MRERAFPEEPEMHERRIEIGESIYAYYSHSGLPEFVEYRRLTEEWLSHYPEEHQHAFLRRFRGKDPRGHESAFFELFLHERLRMLCDKIEVEGELVDPSGKRADFVLHYTDGSAVTVEALSLARISFTSDPIVERVNEWIREIQCRDFSIWFGECDGQLTSTPKKREVQGWAKRVLSEYSWEEADTLVRFTDDRFIKVEPLVLDGWIAQAKLMVKPSAYRIESSCLGARVGQSFKYYNVPAAVRKRIDKKIRSKKVDRGSIPFILAVNINDSMFRPDEEELEVLYGFKHRIRDISASAGSPPVVPDPQSVFSPDGTKGIWSTSNNEAQYERCDAIWFFHQVDPSYPQGRRDALHLYPFVDHDERMTALAKAAADRGTHIPPSPFSRRREGTEESGL